MAKKSASTATEPSNRPEATPAVEASAFPANSAGYTVLARRYRPQSFAELVGHEAIIQTLTNAIQKQRMAHALLFTGTRGVGKTTLARILAKCLNCEKGPTATPCNVCDMCRGITSGDDVDVVEIDAASNTGVDNIRDLRSNTQYRPARSRFKIYIIDEVHMLSNSSFAALLKTLEEPPPHVKFFFATTDPQEIPPAILSRCQRYELRGFSPERICEHLGRIVAAEGLSAEPEALELIARRARGSMRDGQSLLDQLLAYGAGTLTAEQVHRLLGTSSDERIQGIAAAVLSGNSGEALSLLDRAEVQGAQMNELVDQLITYWRDLMALQVAGEAAPNLSVAPGRRGTVAEQAKKVSPDAVMAGLDVLTATRMRLRDNDHARTLVEMALVRLTRLKELVGLPQLAQWLASGQVKLPAGAPANTGRPVSAPEAVKKNDRNDASGVKSAMHGATTAPAVLSRDSVPSAESLANNLPALWEQVLAQVGGMLAGDLRHAGLPATLGPNALVLRFPVAYNQQRDYSQRQVGRLEQVLLKLTGRPWTVRIESAGGPVPERLPEAPPERPRANPREEAEKIPLVRRAMEVLGGQIVRADEGFGKLPESPRTEPEADEER